MLINEKKVLTRLFDSPNYKLNNYFFVTQIN
jgi:hypothetical protein